MVETEILLNGFLPTDIESVRSGSLQDRVDRAILLLQTNEPPEGYYLAFSGGKDSGAAKRICEMAGVRFNAVYNQTTIDPPELVRFIKTHHADVAWSLPKHGNMMVRVALKSAAPPTRMMRWCCEEYKEHGGQGRTKVMGVRASESPKRKRLWREITQDQYGNMVICPIVFWLDEHVWEFTRFYSVPYCSLYDEGWARLGCVGCPLNNESRIKEFERWPAFERNWKKAIIANWQKWKDVPTLKGTPRFQARFATGEEFWTWWMQEKRPDVFREDCQSGLLWTNSESEGGG